MMRCQELHLNVNLVSSMKRESTATPSVQISMTKMMRKGSEPSLFHTGPPLSCDL